MTTLRPLLPVMQRARTGAGGAGVFGEVHGGAGLERHGHPGRAGQLAGDEIEGEADLR
jgi:hypothetical protein